MIVSKEGSLFRENFLGKRRSHEGHLFNPLFIRSFMHFAQNRCIHSYKNSATMRMNRKTIPHKVNIFEETMRFKKKMEQND